MIRRAIGRLNHLRSPSVDPSFDELLQKRIDEFIERNTIAVWLRRFAGLAAAAVVLIGGVVGAGIAVSLLESVKGARDSLLHQVEQGTNQVNERTKDAMDQLKRFESDLAIQVAQVPAQVKLKVSERAQELTHELEQRREAMLQQVANLEAKLEQDFGVLESAASALQRRQLAIDTSMGSFEEQFITWINQKRGGLKTLTDSLVGVAQIDIGLVADGASEQIKRFETDQLAPTFRSLNDRIGNIRAEVAKLEYEVIERFKQAEQRLAEVEAMFGAEVAAVVLPRKRKWRIASRMRSPYWILP